MHRFFASPDQISPEEIIFAEAEARHITTVLRLGVGDEILVLDGEGQEYRVRLSRADKKSVVGAIVSSHAVTVESPLKIHLGQSLIKGNRLDDLIRKTVELGVHAVSLLKTDRTVLRIKEEDARDRTDRWQKIAREAAKQSGRNVVPNIGERIERFKTFVAAGGDADLKIMFWEEEGTRKPADLATEVKDVNSVCLLMGPEGGFSQEEAGLARESGFHTLSLGPRILRADTATVTALSVVQHLWGDL